MKYLYLVLSSIILAYIIIVLFTYLYQRKLLYHPSENNYTGDEIQFEYKEVFIEVDKDIKLKSWFLEKDLKKNKTILYFHGNAGDLTNRVHKLNELYKLDVNILIISWRGFSGNPGKPTEENLYNDARKSVVWLNNYGIENKNIILYGESLGTGIATELGQNNSFSITSVSSIPLVGMPTNRRLSSFLTFSIISEVKREIVFLSSASLSITIFFVFLDMIYQ